MAQVKKQMVNKERVIIEEAVEIVITLSEREAQVLRRVVGNVSGDHNGPRGQLNSLYGLLADMVKSDNSIEVTGQINLS